MNAFDEPMEELVGSDILGLIRSKLSERKYVDDKRALPDFNRNNAKEDLLNDVSAFANAADSCIVHDMPTHVADIVDQSFNESERQLKTIVRAHLRPRCLSQR